MAVTAAKPWDDTAEPSLLTSAWAADWLGISHRQVQDLCRDGILTAAKLQIHGRKGRPPWVIEPESAWVYDIRRCAHDMKVTVDARILDGRLQIDYLDEWLRRAAAMRHVSTLGQGKPGSMEDLKTFRPLPLEARIYGAGADVEKDDTDYLDYDHLAERHKANFWAMPVELRWRAFRRFDWHWVKLPPDPVPGHIWRS